ncbi:MAG: hypothetical protein IT357_18125 [Gemmatimonadaceae bacterium]|nr:hypothetical protein [Gemmatimonadaceae bacterium]
MPANDTNLAKRLEFLRDRYWGLLKLGLYITMATAVGTQFKDVRELQSHVYWTAWSAGVLGWYVWWRLIHRIYGEIRRIESVLGIPPSESYVLVFPEPRAHFLALLIPVIAIGTSIFFSPGRSRDRESAEHTTQRR